MHMGRPQTSGKTTSLDGRHVVSQSPRGTYLDIARVLREQIESGDFTPGVALPSEADLVRRFGVARETIRRSLAVLQREDIVNKRQGKGWFVGTEPELLPAELANVLSTLRVAISEEFDDGAKFYSEKDLTEKFSITRHQARQVLGVLEAEGKLLTKQGIGRFVQVEMKGRSSA